MGRFRKPRFVCRVCKEPSWGRQHKSCNYGSMVGCKTGVGMLASKRRWEAAKKRVVE